MSPKQQAFVREYLVDHNGAQAAIRAGYSPRTSKQKASELKKKLAAAIAGGEALAEEASERQREDLLRDVVEMTRQAAAAGRYDVALRGLELEAKLHGWLTERRQVEVSGALDVERLELARQRVINAGLGALLAGTDEEAALLRVPEFRLEVNNEQNYAQAAAVY